MHGHTILKSNGQATQQPKTDLAWNHVKFVGAIENVILGQILDNVVWMAKEFSDQKDRKCKRRKRSMLGIT